MAISKRLRYEILRRDNFACRYCGATASGGELTVDHVIPRTLGGNDDPENLVTACQPCNAGKTSSLPGANPVPDVLQETWRWARAIRRAQAESITVIRARERGPDQVEEWWNRWGYGEGEKRRLVAKDEDWHADVDKLLLAGLPVDSFKVCIDQVMGQRHLKDHAAWSTMIGLARRHLSDVHARAAAIAGLPGAAALASDKDLYTQGRIDAAQQVLDDLPAEVSERFIQSTADYAAYEESRGGEPQTEDDKLTEAAADAACSLWGEFDYFRGQVFLTLAELPGGIGERALRDARRTMYERCGADFDRADFLRQALFNVRDEMRLPEAQSFLDLMSAAERQEWRELAVAAHPMGCHSETGWTVRAADAAQYCTEGPAFLAYMCVGPGTSIRACPNRGAYRARLTELMCCGPEGPDKHNGHLFCERHMEQLVDGTFISPRGRSYTLIDYADLASEAVPF